MTELHDLADLFDRAPCGYLTLTPGGKIAMINRTLTCWLGRSDESLEGTRFADLLSFGGRIAVETHLAPLLRLRGHVDELALDLLHADGSKVPVIANAAARHDASGALALTRITLFKAVERRSYERSLVAARSDAEARVADERATAELREQFIAVLGHDLRNPLAALISGIAMLSAKESLSERGRLIVKEMDASARRALDLIKDVLDFARGRLGQGIPLELTPDVDVQAVLEQIVAEVRAFAGVSEVGCHLAIFEPVPCDPVRIGQLASNLLGNALTHGDPSTPVVLEAETRDGVFTLSVVNGGKPIDSATRENLFQPFFRGGERASQQGLGLGLFIVSEIARAHGGTIAVTSDTAETRFTFTMPITPG